MYVQYLITRHWRINQSRVSESFWYTRLSRYVYTATGKAVQKHHRFLASVRFSGILNIPTCGEELARVHKPPATAGGFGTMPTVSVSA